MHRTGSRHRPAAGAGRPVWLAAGATGAVVAGVTAGVLALGSAPAMAAYSVSQHAGTLSVSAYNASGVAGANGALRHIAARVVVVPVHPGCPPMGSLPRPHPAPHPPVEVGAEVRGGHRYVSVMIGKPGIPRGDTMILAFFGSGRPGTTSGGAGGIITGRVPRCVSLPPAPSGRGGADPASTVTGSG